MEVVFLHHPRFFFVTAKINVKEMCVFIYYIHYSPYLKCEGCWFPPVLGIWNIPLHRPTIARKHSCTPLSLVPLALLCPWYLLHHSVPGTSCTPLSLVPLAPLCPWYLLHSSVPGTSFPRQKCLGGNVPRVRHWRHQDCQGRNPSGSPTNVSWGTYYTPYLGMTVTVHPQFHGSWGLYDYLKILHNTFKWLPRLFFNLT